MERGLGHDMASINRRCTRRSRTCKVTVHPSLWHLAGPHSASFTRRRAAEGKFSFPAPSGATKAHCRAPGPASRHIGGFVRAPQASPNPSFNASPNGWPVLPCLRHFGYRRSQFRPVQPLGPR
jgi:hypothetical protein